MPQEVIDTLAQAKPLLVTETVLYTVPDGSRTVVSILNMFNENAAASTVKVAIVPSGNNDIVTNPTLPQHYLLNDLSIPTKEREVCEKLTLNERTDVRIESSTGDVVFHLYGVEVIPDKT